MLFYFKKQKRNYIDRCYELRNTDALRCVKCGKMWVKRMQCICELCLLSGDLLYLYVVTLEDKRYHITASTRGFYLNQ